MKITIVFEDIPEGCELFKNIDAKDKAVMMVINNVDPDSIKFDCDDTSSKICPANGSILELIKTYQLPFTVRSEINESNQER